jgi:D-proline reductase (dithiol) PrdB
VCHQTVSLVSRHLEAAGIPTVVVGSARDIVEECGVARLLFVDFPLGNPCGRPDDRTMQQSIVSLALDLVDTAIAPRTTVQAPVRWESDNWRAEFMEVGDHNIKALQAAGAKRRKAQATS